MEEDTIYAWAALLAIFIIPLASMAPRMIRKIMKKQGKFVSKNNSRKRTISNK